MPVLLHCEIDKLLCLFHSIPQVDDACLPAQLPVANWKLSNAAEDKLHGAPLNCKRPLQGAKIRWVGGRWQRHAWHI